MGKQWKQCQTLFFGAPKSLQMVTAIDTLGGGKFTDPASISKATSMGYVASEIPKLARVANIYQQATGCTDAEAETAALDPSSKARRLYDYGGRFTQNVDGFKAGLGLMDKFSSWYDDLAGDREAKTRDTPTKRNANFVACSDKAKIGVEKFVFEELSVNGNIPLDAQNPEDIFGMEKNPAMQFVGRAQQWGCWIIRQFYFQFFKESPHCSP